MAVYRDVPKCPWCGKIIAKEKKTFYYPWQEPIIGDDFQGWEYLDHKCKKKPKMKTDGSLNDFFKQVLKKEIRK